MSEKQSGTVVVKGGERGMYGKTKALAACTSLSHGEI